MTSPAETNTPLVYDQIQGWDRDNIHTLCYQLAQLLNKGLSGGVDGYDITTSHSIDSYCFTIDALLRQLGWYDDMFEPDREVNPPHGAPKPPGHYIWELYK